MYRTNLTFPICSARIKVFQNIDTASTMRCLQDYFVVNADFFADSVLLVSISRERWEGVCKAANLLQFSTIASGTSISTQANGEVSQIYLQWSQLLFRQNRIRHRRIHELSTWC